MKRLGFIMTVLAFALTFSGMAAHAAKGGFKTDTGTYTGDFDELLKRRVLRVAVPFSRTQFFYNKGRQCGLTADAIRELERRLVKHLPRKRFLSVVVTPMTFDRLLPSLLEGKADIAAGSITVTGERLKSVDFTVPITDSMNEIVVT